TAVWAIVGMLMLATFAEFFWLQRQNDDTEVAEELVVPEKAEAAIRRAPPRPALNILLEGEMVAPAATPGASPAADSVEARNFRTAATDLQQRVVIRAPGKPALLAFDVAGAHAKLAHAIDPRVAFPFRLSAFVKIPGRSFDRPEDIMDAMAHPDFEDA